MAVTSVHFLTCAERHLEAGDEIEHRTSCSRAYYAVYHTALEQAEALALDQPPCNAGFHKKLQLRYQHAPIKEGKYLADQLMKLHKARVCADYALISPFSHNEARTFVGLAKKIIEKLNAIQA